MRKNLLPTFLSIAVFGIMNMQAQNVPNGGFESWSNGDPANWLTNNIPTIITTVTQATPSHSGAMAAKGTTVTTGFGNVQPLIQSTDQSGNGFVVSQAYSTVSFYYKTSLTAPDVLAILISMKDAGGNLVGTSGAFYAGNVSSYTLASVPIYYTSFNPVECILEFSIIDTTGSGISFAGNYFIVDDVSLSGLASVQELAPSMSIENVYPNPVNNSASIHYNLQSKSDVQFQLLNTQGKIVRQVNLAGESAGKHEMKFDVGDVPSGFYFLRMKTNHGIAFNRLQVAR